MSAHFYTLTVKDINKETADCVSVSFLIPNELKEVFAFQQGQHITIKKNIAGEEIRRNYSLCTAPIEDQYRIAIKKIDSGLFSTFANDQLQVGDQLEVMPPLGKFNTALHPSHQKKYVAFAAGSGITPIISNIKTILYTEPKSECVLVYGNKYTNSIIFKEELEALKNKFLGRLQLIHVLSRERTETPINNGRIDAIKLEQLSKLIQWKNIDEYFLCGPEEMIVTTKDFLEDLGIDRKKIHFELFNATAKPKTVSATTTVSNVKSVITLISDGRTFEVAMNVNDNLSILDAALNVVADLPFACKGGVCCTCKAKLIEGKVEMDVNWGLEQEEVEQGYILTCQSHPTTEKVVVDFDVK
ncbi:MAG: phenylacetate-CoA oxygenase/reductase subunit PaaK [Chitinophagaceae bacterium]|nr:phenylacetate-CoA oxygenase/reductase subunit PaaK [Chitinophagaceae bacterium]